MKPDVILQSDVLDIIFENKNKDYGAYALRKNYNKRLIQALGGTFLAVGLFIVLQSMKPQDQLEGNHILPPDTRLTDVIIQNPAAKEEEKPKPKQSQPKQNFKTVTNFTPVIQPDDRVVETTVNTTEDVSNHQIGNKPSDGKEGGGDQPFSQPSTTGVGETIKEPEFDVITVRDYADVMPSFNGDIVRFMLRNLRQPEDLEEGQKILVRVRFVVTADGAIDDVQIVNSGRPDLDQEVLRVVKKMPRWNAGKQGGRNVPVYFYLPVTFVSNAE